MRFQSTLPRRERPEHFVFLSHIYYFNPRSREGSDPILIFLLKASSAFQSTLPRRERPYTLSILHRLLQFQSTLPRRERLLPILFSFASHYFNPRSREGSDRFNSSCSPFYYNFNPRSREGSDDNFYSNNLLQIYFNPRSREGSDQQLLQLRQGFVISIHAPAKGATFCVIYFSCTNMYFNPRSREGSDCKFCTLFIIYSAFQSTLPRRERPSFAVHPVIIA